MANPVVHFEIIGKKTGNRWKKFYENVFLLALPAGF